MGFRFFFSKKHVTFFSARPHTQQKTFYVSADRNVMTSQDSFDTLYKQHFRAIFSFTFKLLQSREDALEVTQDTFVELCTVISDDKMEHIESVERWLYGVARHKVHARYRRRKTQHHEPIDPHQEAVVEQESIERVMQRKAFHRWLEGHIEQVNVQLLLLFLKGFRVRELAEEFGLSEVVVKKRIQRTKEQALTYFHAKE